MYCPSCRAEYREGFTECADCGVDLVDTMPAEADHPSGPFTVVFQTADTSLLPIIESLLDGASIPYLVQGGETAGGLFPMGSIGGGSDERLLGAVIKVPDEHAEAASALLAEAVDIPESDAGLDESE